MLLHGPLLAGGDYKDTIRTSSGCFLQIRLQEVPKGNALMKEGIADNTERNEMRGVRKIPIGQNRCVSQSNLICNSKIPFPLETPCILVLPTRFFGRTRMRILRYVGNMCLISS